MALTPTEQAIQNNINQLKNDLLAAQQNLSQVTADVALWCGKKPSCSEDVLDQTLLGAPPCNVLNDPTVCATSTALLGKYKLAIANNPGKITDLQLQLDTFQGKDKTRNILKIIGYIVLVGLLIYIGIRIYKYSKNNS